jgi:hypothetical protein
MKVAVRRSQNFDVVLARQILDDVWSRFTKLSSPVRGNEVTDDFYERLGRDVGVFDAPQAATTRVLVAGATGR